LENDSPAALVSLLEMFVSLLRAKAKTKPVDVELFFKDHRKLVSKMGRVPTTQCDIDIVKAYLEKL
jgi:hypothetical protein